MVDTGPDNHAIQLVEHITRVYRDAADKKGFMLDFDDAWEWAGYSRKANAKRVLTRGFVEGTDYLSLPVDTRPEQNGGRNK
jgi:hypothetical protein